MKTMEILLFLKCWGLKTGGKMTNRKKRSLWIVYIFIARREKWAKQVEERVVAEAEVAQHLYRPTMDQIRQAGQQIMAAVTHLAVEEITLRQKNRRNYSSWGLSDITFWTAPV
jgi:hypothetical protein